MRHAVVVLATLLAACADPDPLPDEHEEPSLDGEWLITRSFAEPSCAVAYDTFESLSIRIEGDVVTMLSPDMTVRTAVVSPGEILLVVDETWYVDPQLEQPPFTVPVTYNLSSPRADPDIGCGIPGQLEGAVGYSLLVGTDTCAANGTANGRLISD